MHDKLRQLSQVVKRYEGTYITHSTESHDSHWLEEMTTAGDVHVQAHGTTLNNAISTFGDKWCRSNNVPRSELPQ